MYFSNSTRRVYTVTHGFAQGGSRIMIFALKYSDSHLSLAYERSITSPLFLNGGINDVIEGSLLGKELYVTQWLQYPVPMHGKHHPNSTSEKLNNMYQELANSFVLTLKDCYIFKCTWKKDRDEKSEDAATCEVAKGTQPSPHYNGITTSSDRSTVFVNDLFRKQILVFGRSDDGSLVPQPKRTIPLVWPVDNIEYDHGTGKLFMGSMPKIVYAFLNSVLLLDWKVPGGLQVAELSGSATKQKRWKVNGSAFMHSGEKLSQVSAALQYGNKVILGSPMSKGVLICDYS
jgi:hypothetical protein